jgi:3-oxoacyl-(acyl-carrier-protein) synthase
MWAINELTKQLETGNSQAIEHSEQVKVMVETLAQANGQKSEELQKTVEELTKFQKAQLKQAALAVKSSELARRSQRRHHSEIARTQQSRLSTMQHDQSRYFNRIEEHFKRSARTQFILTGAAGLIAIAALTFAVLMGSGVIDLGSKAQPTAGTPAERPADGSVVSR